MNKIKYDGAIELDGFTLPCYVLEDGTRVLSGFGMQQALKMIDKDDAKQTGDRVARYLGQKSLKTFLYSGKSPAHYKPLVCYQGEQKINGYEATILVDIRNAFLEARKHIKLSLRQAIIAEQCEILVRSFAKVGIIALVDEATGYQYKREKEELQKILKAFISEQIARWESTYNIDFYKEIFRLWKLPFTPKNIKRKPQFIGMLTNTYIYDQLLIGVDGRKELKRLSESSNARFHQWLTKDVVRTALKQK